MLANGGLQMTVAKRARVVVVGGGFGGLNVVRALRREECEVTLVDRRNFHLFQPLLYQVATGGLSPANIAAPLRKIFRRQRNARVLMGEVTDFDPIGKKVMVGDGEGLPYDTLVVAVGATTSYFGQDQWERHAPGLKSLEDATLIRKRVLMAFERAEREESAQRRQQLLTFVVIGGGATGVELAGTLGEIARDTLRRDFRHFDPKGTTILLVEAADRVLAGFDEPLSAAAQRALERLGVSVRLRQRVSRIDETGVLLEGDDQSAEGGEFIATENVIWAAGVKAHPLTAKLQQRFGCSLDRSGRVCVTPQLHLENHPDVYCIGDMALVQDSAGNPLPGIAPVAMQQGRYVAEAWADRRRGRDRSPFQYKDRGTMATIGRASAVADIKGMHLTGYPAWLSWLFVHLLFLVGFDNKVLVLFQWAWNYLTFQRGARLILDSGGGAEADQAATDGAAIEGDASNSDGSSSKVQK